MGYYTSYKLSVQNNDSDVITELREGNDNASFALNKSGDANESCKWYDHEEEITEFSKLHPDTLFVLSGEGEDPGDIWKKYFRNGKMQTVKAKIVFDEFDESKLV